ncbi:MAG: cobalamin biosynthesis protein CbiM [Chloroflexi bacterium]|nr:cobalamin biosynthesis protein CbiM [Chloroflexota bacterium]
MHLSPPPMHIPDGFLSVLVSALFWAVSALVIAVALRRVSRDLGEREAPLMGVLAAAIFAGQMLNFSVTGGTSGHLLGAALAAILVGPWAAVLVMTAVVATQALIFQDGGLVVMGANLFNMAVVGVAVGYAVYRLAQKLTGGQRWGILASGFLAAWASILIASLSCALQLALSGTSPVQVAVPAMAGIHALIGVGEGLITIGALAFVLAARPDLLSAAQTPAKHSRGLLVGGLGIATLLAVFSPLASSHPDGLEWVAEQAGFLEAARGPWFEIIPDYVLPGIQNEALATILAGVIGVMIVLAAVSGVTLARRKQAVSEQA